MKKLLIVFVLLISATAFSQNPIEKITKGLEYTVKMRWRK